MKRKKMSLIRVYNGVNGIQKLINLGFVSTIHLKKNKIMIYKIGEREEIYGNAIWFAGGESKVDEIIMTTQEEAQKEFDDIQKTMENYFSKKIN